MIYVKSMDNTHFHLCRSKARVDTILAISFLLELTTGSFTGPNVKNYYLHANLLLKDDQSGGWEMIKTRTEKFRCDQLPEEKAKLTACSKIVPLRASDILYKLSDP